MALEIRERQERRQRETGGGKRRGTVLPTACAFELQSDMQWVEAIAASEPDRTCQLRREEPRARFRLSNAKQVS